MKSAIFALAVLAGLGLSGAVAARDPAPTVRDLEGLWEASAFYGPELRGAVTVERTPLGWRADLKGRLASGSVGADGRVLFDFGENRSLSFDPASPDGAFWRQGAGGYGYNFLTPVSLAAEARGRWRGEVRPLDDVLTLYLPVRVGPDGAAAFIRNPEANVGRFLKISRVELADGEVRLIGRPFGAREDEIVGRGPYDPDNDTVSIYIRRVGQGYVFHRVGEGRPTGFHPRVGGSPYRYAPPPARSDGWPVGTLEEAGLDRAAIERFVQRLIDLPMDSNGASDVHAVLIARRGRLVLEEYFHGFDRDRLHDTRSAAKSIASVLMGAAMQGGVRLGPSTPVYRTLGHATEDAKKQAMTAEHLLLQTSGFFCDDSNDEAPGSEDRMQQQRGQPDWYRYALDLPMLNAPGAAAPVYCSAQPNLLGAVIARTAGQPLEALFRDRIARPMDIPRYAMNLQPTGEPYMGGGLYLTPRDFLKFAQLMEDGGAWRGRRIVSLDWARRSTSPLETFGDRQYGYLWWSQTYPYKGRQVRAFYAAGNGGQIAMAVPELELVIGFMGGNYSDPALYIPQRSYIPEFILPAVQ
ncbi:MAG: beta-lactamase family protein [Caulobacteraceae bacterium]|nr:beta-lactamase family protein [Caulobacteraceae bacterium]